MSEKTVEKADLILRGGRVIDPFSGLDGNSDLAFSGGKISALAPSLNKMSAYQEIDVNGKIVCTGLIDLQTHL